MRVKLQAADINGVPGLMFSESEGWITFHYRESYRGRYEIECSGIVPISVQEQGTEAIRTYAEERCRQYVSRQRERIERHIAFEANPNFPVETTDEGVVLKGRIVSVTDGGRQLNVRLEEPYAGEACVRYNFMSAMAGHSIFDGSDPPRFTANAIATAQSLLIDIYQRERHRRDHAETIATVTALNRGTRSGPRR